VRGLFDGAFGDLDADDLLEVAGGADRKQAAAAVGIDEMLRASGLGLVDGVADELGQDEGVVLEEIARLELKADAIHILDGDFIVAGEHAVRSGTHEQRGTVFEGVGVGASTFAHGGELRIQLGHGDGAVLDIDHGVARACAEEADGADATALRAMEVRRDLGAVAVFDGRGNDLAHGVLDLRHVLEQFGDLALLRLKLLGIREVLILAAAALAEERALGRDTIGCWLQHLDEIGLAVVLVIAKDAALHQLTGERERNENDPAIDTGDTGALVGEVVDPDVELLMVGEGMRIEFARRFHAARHFFSGFSMIM
jgi:hypothetical protein